MMKEASQWRPRVDRTRRPPTTSQFLHPTSEPAGRLAAKLPGYLQLAQASQLATPLLLWLPSPAREAAARQALSGSSLPVATATPHPDHTPAGPLWLPLHTSGRRCRLAQLASAW
jgi:hypothetical protein